MKKVSVLIISVIALIMMTACGESRENEVDLQVLMTSIESGVELPQDMTDLTASTLEVLYNIDGSLYIQFVGKFTEIGILGDEVVIIEASSEEAATKLLNEMEERYQIKLNQMKDYLPEEYEKIENGRVVQVGNYVAILVCTDQEKLDEVFDSNIK